MKNISEFTLLWMITISNYMSIKGNLSSASFMKANQQIDVVHIDSVQFDVLYMWIY